MGPTTTVIGIDVGQQRLEIAVLPAQTGWSCSTTPAALGELVRRIQAHQPQLVVLEASGGYERPVVSALSAAEVPLAVVNPRRVRAFARAQGQAAKTDRLDAAVLASFGQLIQPAPRRPQPAQQERLRALVRRREQLLAMRSAEQQRRRQLERVLPEVVALIDQMIALLSAQCHEVEARIAALVAADPCLAGRAAQLEGVPGVGPIVAATLLAELPELGQVSDKEIAALAGVAPYSRDSGQWRGQRRIGGGRASVRRVLYLAAVSARVHNDRIRPFAERLVGRGKPSKVVLVACARKLLTLLNTLVATGMSWQPASAQP